MAKNLAHVFRINNYMTTITLTDDELKLVLHLLIFASINYTGAPVKSFAQARKLEEKIRALPKDNTPDQSQAILRGVLAIHTRT